MSFSFHLFKHLRHTGGLMSYMRLLLIRHRHTVAYLFLVAAVSFAISSAQGEGDARRAAIVETGRIVAVDGCNRDFRSLQAIRSVLIAAKAQHNSLLRRKLITKVQHDDAIRFYDVQLRGVELPDCRKSLGILSEDPDKKIATPEPLYAGSPRERQR